MKFIKTVFLSLVLLGLTFSLRAGQGSITATNSTVLTATTNLLSGTAAYFFAGGSSDITFQPTCTLTNASTNTFVFDGSADSATWVANLVRVTVSQTATTTNVCSGITNLPAGLRYPYWRAWVENPSIYATKSPSVATFIKSGI